MLDIRFATVRGTTGAVAVVVPAGSPEVPDDTLSPLRRLKLGPADLDDITAFLTDVEHTGSAGSLHKLFRSGRTLLFVGGGDGGETDWRAAGAALARSARGKPALTVLLPDEPDPAGGRGLAEGLWLASYRFHLGSSEPPALRRIRLVAGADLQPALAKALDQAVELARVVAARRRRGHRRHPRRRGPAAAGAHHGAGPARRERARRGLVPAG